MITAQDLDRIPALNALSPEDKFWLAQQARELTAATGEIIFQQGAPAEDLYFLLSGTVIFRAVRDGEDVGQFVVEEGAISGRLPRSRMTHWSGTGRAAKPVRAAVYHREVVEELIRRIPALDGILAATLADRIRETTRMEQQQDKLMALGKLSAGLAHELNNPAAAIRRTTDALRARMKEFPERVTGLLAHALDPAQFDFACTLEDRVGRRQRLTTVQRSEREDALADWLEDQGVASASVLAETFVEAGLDEQALAEMVAQMAPDARADVLNWVEVSVAANLMLREIAASAARISEIVQSVKRYSHMDEAAVHEPTDVHEGLDSTLTMLAHELRTHNVRVVKKYADALPRIEAIAGQLNQVWTNLIDNAIAAMPDGGELRLVTRQEGDSVYVEIIDEGTGIPEDVQRRVFEPFFTTKAVGEGTGLGLDIAHRIVTKAHGGQITLRSEPGHTNFSVRLPIQSPHNGTPKRAATSPA